ncbi:MAG: hypothetical protein JWO03_2020 [Bacteroidetes bacterium]|nr:hypothetical protein [Bacteroidota bacterium]
MPKYIVIFLLLFYTLRTSAQTGMKDGTISIDFGKKKHKQQDTIPVQVSPDDDEDSVTTVKKVKKQSAPKDKTAKRITAYDIHELGIFRGIFHAGFNAAQVDGDNEWGYKYLGAEFGAGVMARFHPYVSTSLEINYSMQGARARLPSSDQVSRRYMVQWDYVEAPISLNAHYRDIVMISGGLIPGIMVRYKELDYDGINVTKNPPIGQPRQFALSAYGGLHVFIKKHYGIGFIYRYSVIKVRDAYTGTRVSGQFNNVMTIRFVYMLGSVKKKK